MKNGNIKINGVYGAKVGHRQVFTYSGAVRMYKIFASVCYGNITMESSSVLSDAAQDMIKLGFSWDELEQFEHEVLSA